MVDDESRATPHRVPGATAGLDGTSRTARWFPWALRACWVATGVLGSSAIADAVDDRSAAVELVATWGAAAGWVVGVIAMAVPATISLTATRVVVPLAAVAAGATLAGGASGPSGVAFLATAVVGVVIAMSGELGLVFVQASAYGDEQRFSLRPPFGYAVVAVAAWCLWAAAVVAGPLLVAARAWVAGGVVTAIAVAGGALLAVRWHLLSRRWLVYVPAGVVVHDPVVLGETLMLRRSQVAGMRLAAVGTEALDVTGPATGHALEISVAQPVTALFAPTRAQPRGRAVHLTALLVAPSRPGLALAAARRRRLPVG